MRKHAAARRVEVVELAATGASPKVIAEALGLSDRQVRHYLHDPTTGAELRRMQDERLKALMRRALRGADVALGVLRGVAEDGAQPAGARVAAARALLENALRLIEATTIAEWLDAIEAWIGAADEGDDGKQKRWQRWPA